MSSNTVVEIKGSMYSFLSLKLHSTDPVSIGKALADKVQQAPGFFSNTPVVINLTVIEDKTDVNIGAIMQSVRDNNLVPVVACLSNRDGPLCAGLDIPVVEADTRNQKNTDNQQISKDDETDGGDSENTSGDSEDNRDTVASQQKNSPPKAELDPIDLAMTGTEVEYIIKKPKLVSRPVRSGQQVYSRDTDLVVLGQIGPGAEVISDNNIHVYGPLRGRALCGVTGNQDARIFCQSLEAELVSVAGTYKVLEDQSEALWGKPAQIRMENDNIVIEGL